MSTRTIATSMLGLLLAATAAASPGEYDRDDVYYQRGPLPFEALDLDRDGVVTAGEHAQVHRERYEYRANKGYPMRNAANAPSFEQIDGDGNGSISREELQNWQTQRMQQRGMGGGAR